MKTRAFFKTCPICGAALDPGEKCECKEDAKKGAATSQALTAKATQPPRSTTTRGHTVDSIAWHGPEHKKGVYDMFTGEELLKIWIKERMTPGELQAFLESLDIIEGRRDA